MKMAKKQLISLVVACYNESKNIEELHRRVVSVFENISYDFELIFVDNKSTDCSEKIYENLVKKDSRIRVVFMARNFGGPQPSYFAGMKEAKGDAVVLLDGDLQDPPELVSDFIKKWEEGYKVVYGVRETRVETLVRRIGYKVFYRILRHLSFIDIPLDAGEFGLMDRRIVNIIIDLPEKDILIRGLRAWAGLSQTGVKYHRPNRKRGKTTFSFLGYVQAAKNAVVNFSYKPLEYVSAIAMGSAFLTSIASIFYLYCAVTQSEAPKGFFTILMAVMFFGTLQLLALGVIAEYLIRIFREVKSRPAYVVDRILSSKRVAEK
jgi:polyisoprenyl-phosphate glycosyltransferase